MAATVNGGSLGRWFEELCRVRYRSLADAASADGVRLAPGRLPGHGGVYVFWWTGRADLLSEHQCNRSLALVGPGGREVSLHLDDDWLGLATGLPIPLYVGKSASSIRKRVGQHMMLGHSRLLPLRGGARKAKPPTTSCQLRAGVEHLFPDVEDTRAVILENIGLSYVDLDGDDNAANRFYLEDMAIGLMRPVFNVDIER